MRHHIDNAMVTMTVAAIQAHTGEPLIVHSAHLCPTADSTIRLRGYKCKHVVFGPKARRGLRKEKLKPEKSV
jgi:hypothetical protein